MERVEQRAWADRVLTQLPLVLQPGDDIIFLAGTTYRRDLIDALHKRGYRVGVQMEGLRIGELLSWLKQQLSVGPE